MLHIQSVTSFDDPALAPYRTMRRQAEHQAQHIFVAEGDKVVQRLLESHFLVVSVLLPPVWLEKLRPLLESRSEEIQVYVGEKKLLEDLTGFSMYQGVLAVGKIPIPLTLDHVLQQIVPPVLFAAVDGLSSAENLGVVVRNCTAFGVQALLVSETSGSPYLRRAVRSSMGTIFKLPVVQLVSLPEALIALRQRGVNSVAAHPHASGKTIEQTDLTRSCCLVFGSEGSGLRPEVLDACSEAVAVPMHLGVDSLNVGSAAAVFLYEAQRQRRRACI